VSKHIRYKQGGSIWLLEIAIV